VVGCWCGCKSEARPLLIYLLVGFAFSDEWWGAGMVISLELGADLHMVQLMPLPLTVSCFSKILIGFIFLVLAHPGSPGKRAVKRVCVCVDVVWLVADRCRCCRLCYKDQFTPRTSFRPKDRNSRRAFDENARIFSFRYCYRERKCAEIYNKAHNEFIF